MTILHSCTILVVVFISVLCETNTLTIYKCCEKEYYFKAGSTKCIEKPGTNPSGFQIDDQLDPQMNSSLPFWIPRSLKNVTSKVRYVEYYIKLPFDVKTIVVADENSTRRFLVVDNERHIYELEYFPGEINPLLVNEQSWCFEATEDPMLPIIILTGVKLKLINKCCGKGEILNSHANGCVSKYSSSVQPKRKETLNPTLQPTLTKWFPKQLSRNILKVQYNYYQPGYVWNVVARDEVDATWTLLNSTFKPLMPLLQFEIPGTKIKVHVKESNRSVVAFEGTTESFCFDAVEDGPLAPRVLMGGVTKAKKCCRIGEQIDSDLNRCVPIAGQTVKEDNYGILDIDNLPPDAKWLPASLGVKQVPVQYNFVSTLFGLYLNDILTISNGSYTIQYPQDNPPLVFINVSYTSGHTVLYNTTKYCFDTIFGDSQTSKLILLDDTCREQCFTKCCLHNEIISPNGQCINHNGQTWSPSISSKLSQIKNETITFPYLTLKTRCTSNKFYTNNDIYISPDITKRRQTFKMIFYCYDWQQTADGVKEVVGSCEIPGNARTFETLRPLAVVSAVMLVIAVVMTLGCEETRRSAHGRALICHTVCLAVANSLQTAWFFTQRSGEDCIVYAYLVYFCLVAANFWLTAITFNMAHGFRQPLGAMARGGAGRALSSGSKAAWRRFGIMSAFAWGGTTILSLVTIAAHQLHMVLQWRGIVTPSLFETRTCYMEYLTPKHVNPEMWTFSVDLGSLCYYYGPLAVLVTANGVCVGLTIRTVRGLRNDTAILRRDDPGRAPGCAPPRVTEMLESGLLYAKLLLTAGILELVLEAAAWAASPKYSKDLHSETTLDSWSNAMSFGIAAVFLDLFRSAAVLWLCAGGRRRAKERLQTTWCSLKGLLVRRSGWVRRIQTRAGGMVEQVRAWCSQRTEDLRVSSAVRFSTTCPASSEGNEKDSMEILT